MPDALGVWHDHAPEAVRLGTLTVIDREHFADGCILIAEARGRRDGLRGRASAR